MKNNVLNIKGYYNLRDIGGYPAAQGFSITWGRLLRSDAPKKKSWLARHKLKKYGVNLVIDIREDHELILTPDPMAAATFLEYSHIPLVNDRKRFESYTDIEDIALLYQDFIENSQKQIKLIFERILANPRGCSLVHCVAGKDRTGLIVALILGHCGVDPQIIIDDYAMSSYLLARRISRSGMEREASAKYKVLFTSEPENMKNILDYLDTRYHGCSGYLEHIGLDLKQRERLKQIFLNRES